MKPIEKELLFQMKFISALQASPNKQQVAFLAQQANKKDNNYQATLYVGATPKKRKNLGAGAQALFLTDEKMLVAYAPSKKAAEELKKKRQTSLYTYNLSSDKLSPLITVSLPI